MTEALIETDSALMSTEPMAQTLSVAQITGRMKLIKEVMIELMEDELHYGASFPGDKKKNLLKPGADLLAATFQLNPEFEVMERELGNRHREYRVNCAMKLQRTGAVMANGVGVCSTMETKYRYRISKLKCPNCGEEAVIKGKEDFGGGWLCWARKGGCNSKWADGAPEIEEQERGTIENPDIADVYNTVLKMAKKRAQVDATITATASSSMFTQDAEDHAEEPKKEVKATAQNEPSAKPVDQPDRAAAAVALARSLEAKFNASKDVNEVDAVWAEALKVQTELTGSQLKILRDIRGLRLTDFQAGA